MTDGPQTTPEVRGTLAVVEVPIAEAAERLGLSTEAVRKRIQRGTLAGHKHEGAWFVLLDPMAGRQDDQAVIRPAVQTETAGRQDTTLEAAGQEVPQRSPAGEPAAVDLGPLAELIERQGTEIRQLAEAAAVWQVRALQAEERLKQLTAGDDTPTDAPQAAPFAPGEAQPAVRAPDASASPRPAYASWWRRLFGLDR